MRSIIIKNEDMDIVTHKINEDKNLVITANGDGYSYGAVLKPTFIFGVPHIRRHLINTAGIDNSDEVKERIIYAITTQRGINNEVPVVVDD